MNNRQWKKNYKKEHGYNPPSERIKQRIREELKWFMKSEVTLNISLNETCIMRDCRGDLNV
jgi:hypothetical protein